MGHMAELEPHESIVERMIREAIERGEFDDLSGRGQPIPGAGTADTEGWWIRRWVQRNRAVEANPTEARPAAPADRHDVPGT